ncbi:DUF262 domain-containing protein [Silvibacterium dinghuense]|uniref:DUF262 domain-containing protein n=1 Tax=Silvibacterium dinghuense TaxID=1560006 RepID=A0A4Q1SJ83_9BACT|nr:DUF262 domain-containing protein [Silvibacterium dinghuense]RXS97485.1 DUF262 domain-containing protein [Silvibacterium dinghuense]GGG99420.1 hypothetical protein GCM10011586_13680 [Silvibacterium dinghuense]
MSSPRSNPADDVQLSFITEEQKAAAEKEIVEHSKRIEFYLTEYTVELLASKMESGEFVIPPYQREDTWEPERKHRFIESLLMGLPIPFLFFWESPTSGKLEIVDGSQRLRTIQQFILGGMVLGELENLSSLEGMSFNDLPESRQRKIKNRSIRGIVLNEHADEQARFDLFDRINTGSKIANKAEVRRGALVGPFLNLVIELAQDDQFAALAPVPDKQAKLREREELVTRFFAYGDGLDGYEDRVSPFLFAYAKKMNAYLTENPTATDEYKKRFGQTMKFVSEIFPYGFRRTRDGVATPRARFEAIAIGTFLALKENPALTANQISVAQWLDSDEFREVTGSDGANAIARLERRIGFVRDRLLGIVK